MTNANGAVPARKSAIEQSELYAEGRLLNLFVQQLEGGVAVAARRPLPTHNYFCVQDRDLEHYCRRGCTGRAR
jgi:hypothetical protein